ncbi:MAG: nitrilase-related carbon-nitrogen hydrolase [Acidobacteriota bacterium]|nr:nitrilase-related carbon-nitrogen hydrolase [Acidobacteriota bacterium]
MSILTVAGIQFDIAWEAPEENFRRAEPWMRRGAAAGGRLVVLPEMFATGFSMNAREICRHAPAVRDFLSRMAAELGVWVAGGYAEPGDTDEDRPRNACSIFDPDGEERLHYQKIHPFSLAGEHEHYAGGETLPTVEIEGVRTTCLICYDLRFPEPFRIAADATDLYLVIANWPEVRSAAWSTLLRARAIENQAYVFGVNRVGDAEGTPHNGRSALFDPLGHPLIAAEHQEAVLVGTVDSQRVVRNRERFSFLADRRPGTYQDLP